MHQKHYKLEVSYTASNLFFIQPNLLKPPSQQQINLLIPQITISQRMALYFSLLGNSSTNHKWRIWGHLLSRKLSERLRAKSPKRYDYDNFTKYACGLALCNVEAYNSLFISKFSVSKISLYVSFYCVNNQCCIISSDGGQENFVRLHSMIPGSQLPSQIISHRSE